MIDAIANSARFAVMSLLAASVVGHVAGPISWHSVTMAAISSILGCAIWLAPKHTITVLGLDLFGVGVVIFHTTALVQGWGGCGCFGEVSSVLWERILVSIYLLSAAVYSMNIWGQR